MDAPMTQQNFQAWEQLDRNIQIYRLLNWAAMLEERMAELDPEYRSYHWGLNKQPIGKYPRDKAWSIWFSLLS